MIINLFLIKINEWYNILTKVLDPCNILSWEFILLKNQHTNNYKLNQIQLAKI